MSHPYEPPGSFDSSEGIQASVRGPAIGLSIVSGIALMLGVLALGVDLLIIATGALAELEEANTSPVDKQTQMLVRTIWGLLLIVASSYILYGSIQMLKLRNYGAARAAAILAMIPCVGPCCLLGIPFGIWAFVVLSKPEVQSKFR